MRPVFIRHSLRQENNKEETQNSDEMTFWQENYGFIKDVYDMRHQKMMEWMENVERVNVLKIFFLMKIS